MPLIKPCPPRSQAIKVVILNCTIDNYSFDELLINFNKGVFVSANVHMIMNMQKDPEFLTCYQLSEYCINDSQILYILSRLLKTPLRANIPGSDFFPAFCNYHKNNDAVSIFLLGAKEGVAKTALNKINDKIGRNIIVGEHSPPFGFENNPDICETIVRLINESKATVLVAGLSAPKGEKWVYNHKNKLPMVKWYICAGAAIDFEAGTVQRAPQFLRKIGFEWLFRIWKEPKRLWKRYLIEDIPFFLLFAKQLLGVYKNPFANNERII
jgi:N-acetylglucosaminyldiphosphoundecaprenol N-acetyl-beta-D-mannosaminyltransferase